LFLFGAGVSPAAQQIIAIKADRVETISSGVIENGTIVIVDGKIKAIGNDIEIPEAAKVIDARDQTIFPGLVNPSSRIGLSSPPTGNPTSTPHYRVVDELYPHQEAYKRVLGSGFTTIGLLPADGGAMTYYSGYGYFFGGNRPSPGITGQGAIVRPNGRRPEEMIVSESGLLMINFQANDKTKKVIKGALESVKGKSSSTDPKIQPLVNALQGKMPTFLTCGTPGEVLHLMKLLEPYDKMKLILVAGSQTYRVADELAKKNIPVVLPARLDFESNTRNRINVPKMLADSGVKIALKPEFDNVAGHEDFLRRVAEMVKSGLDREVARKAITIHPAEMLAVDYRLGSLEVGKDANLLILSADPLDVGARINKVMIEGRIVHEAP
jgi:hypothetical protein